MVQLDATQTRVVLEVYTLKMYNRSTSLVSRLAPSLMRFSRAYQLPSSSSKVISIYPVLEQKEKRANILKKLSQEQLDSKLDANNERRKLLAKGHKDCLKAGDIIRVVYDQSKCNYDTFVGYVLSVDRKELIEDASVLLRNQVAKTMVEMRIPIFSPLIERIDVLRKSDGKRKRNKHYYIRNTRLDVGDLEAGLKKR